MLGLCILAIVIGAGNVTITTAGQTSPGEYDVKAAFVFNFLKFIEWPSQTFSDAKKISICIVGEIPVADPFDDLEGQDLMGKKLAVKHLRTLASVRECHVLIIAPSEERRLSAITDAVKGAPTLTIGDTEGFARRGVAINFSMENKKVRFEINAEAARQAGLKISSKLLKLASTVYGVAPAGD